MKSCWSNNPAIIALTLTMWLGLTTALAAADLKLEATLVWGTNEAQSPDPKHKPIGAEVKAKLNTLPLRWQHYFEVKRQTITLPESGMQKVNMSKDCQIVVKNLGKAGVEMNVIGKGENVGCIKQQLPKGEVLVTGGNAANFTGWFIVLKQAE
jgi:hypothetical protein